MDSLSGMTNARSEEMQRLERMLSQQADAARELPSPELRGRILDALEHEPAPTLSAERSGAWRIWLTAAAVIAIAWTARSAFRTEAPRPASDLRMAQIVDVGSNVRWLNSTLVGVAKDAMDQDSQFDAIVIDATRAADALLNGLQRPLRSLGRSDAR